MCFLVLSASTIFRSLFLNTSFCKTDILTLFLIHIFPILFLMQKFQPTTKIEKNKSFFLNLELKLSKNKPNKIEI